MENYRISFIAQTNNETEDAAEALKKLEHHAEYLLDLDNWPCITSVSGLRVENETDLPRMLYDFAHRLGVPDQHIVGLIADSTGMAPVAANVLVASFSAEENPAPQDTGMKTKDIWIVQARCGSDLLDPVIKFTEKDAEAAADEIMQPVLEEAYGASVGDPDASEDEEMTFEALAKWAEEKGDGDSRYYWDGYGDATEVRVTKETIYV